MWTSAFWESVHQIRSSCQAVSCRTAGPCRVQSRRRENRHQRREVLASQSASGFSPNGTAGVTAAILALLCAASCWTKVLELRRGSLHAHR